MCIRDSSFISTNNIQETDHVVVTIQTHGVDIVGSYWMAFYDDLYSSSTIANVLDNFGESLDLLVLLHATDGYLLIMDILMI